MDLHFGLTNHRTTFCRYLRKTPFERMNRHFGMMNTPTMFIRCFRKTLGSEGFWFSCRTSSAKTPFKQRSAVSWQNRSDWRVRADLEMTSRGWRVAPRPRGHTHHYLRWRPMAAEESTQLGTMSKFTNFAGSLPANGGGAVTIPMPFLPEESCRHGPGRLTANGRHRA